MASEYFLKLAREQAPAEAPRVLTPAEKRTNWWHYNWWWFAVGGVLLWIVGSMLWNVLGIGKIRPDYIFAYVGRDELSAQTAAFLEARLTELAQDVNGDGRVKVELRQYALDRGGDLETALYYNSAADTMLMADLTEGESYFFLMEEPRAVQRAYEILANADGTPPAEGDFEVADKVFRWADCPALASLDPEAAGCADLYLGRRCFYSGDPRDHAADDAFWRLITKEATR